MAKDSVSLLKPNREQRLLKIRQVVLRGVTFHLHIPMGKLDTMLGNDIGRASYKAYTVYASVSKKYTSKEWFSSNVTHVCTTFPLIFFLAFLIQ